MGEKLNPSVSAEALNRALALQHRSVLGLALHAGSLTGSRAASVADALARFAAEELHDVRRLAAKVVALGGRPCTDVAAVDCAADSDAALDWLIETETDAIDALVEAIPADADDPQGEALEHLLEHAVMRKHEQLDFLRRVRGAGEPS